MTPTPLPVQALPGRGRLDRVRDALLAARRRLLEMQAADGHWCAELEGDSILESEYALTLHFLGRSGGERVRQAANTLRENQLPSGGWAPYPGGPPDVSASVKAYFVLKLVGDDPDSPHMARARRTILGLGGLDACNSFTKLYLAIFGQYRWRDCPAVPPELALFPTWMPFNLYEMSAWSRAIVVPLSIIWASKPRCPVPEGAGIADLRGGEPPARPRLSLRRAAWGVFFRGVDTTDKLLEKLKVRPLRGRALRRAERWILDRLPESDGLGAIFPPIINTIIALRCLGYAPEREPLAEQIRQLERLELREGDRLKIQPCFSPVWDTALAINSLAESGVEPDHPVLAEAARWLLAREVKRPGDWRVKNPKGPVGGWYFEYANEFYPDCDDTAEVLTALSKVRLRGEGRKQLDGATRRGLGWLLSMQNSDGGWASFDRGCDKEYLTFVPFADHNAMIDPSTVDITARTLETLACHGFDRSSPAVRRAVRFVLEQQEADGSWYGRWGCNYLYGTWLALWGLAAIGEDPSQEWGRRAADWVRSCQNPDGGWGESPASYADPSLKGQGPSTAAQTAWALMALFASGERDGVAIRRGVDYLLRTQSDGGWRDENWTGTGFPRVFYLRYHLYADYFPLLALATYTRRLGLEIPDVGHAASFEA